MVLFFFKIIRLIEVFITRYEHLHIIIFLLILNIILKTYYCSLKNR